jgi:hypothetical protein
LSIYTVDRLSDNDPGGSGEGSDLAGDLRYCITNAANGDDIGFGDGVTGTINLAGALPTLGASISIDGPGADLLTVRRDTGGDYRIFTLGGGTNVTISGLTITNGYAVGDPGRGGGIYSAGATLTLANCVVTRNLAQGTAGEAEGGGLYGSGTIIGCRITNNTAIDTHIAGYGGGLYGDFTIIDSTISDNYASGYGATYGGGIYTMSSSGVTVISSTISGNHASFGGGIAGSGLVLNSTLSGNDALASGGGIDAGATFTLISSTVSNNLAVSSGGGIRGNPTARNTIMAGNGALSAPDLSGHLYSIGHNLIGNSQGGSGFDETDILDVDPRLGPLQDNGGPTFTRALLPDSPAIDAGDNTDAPDWDQRGEGFPRIVNGIIDIGAFEYQGDGTAPNGRSRANSQAQLATALPHDALAIRQTNLVSPSQQSSAVLLQPPIESRSERLPQSQSAVIAPLSAPHPEDAVAQLLGHPVADELTMSLLP